MVLPTVLHSAVRKGSLLAAQWAVLRGRTKARLSARKKAQTKDSHLLDGPREKRSEQHWEPRKVQHWEKQTAEHWD
jgi:hypothetical protein